MSGIKMRYEGYIRYVVKSKIKPVMRKYLLLLISDVKKKNKPVKNTVSATMPSAFNLDKFMCTGVTATIKAENKAVSFFLKIKRANKYTGITSNAPVTAINALEPNSLFPNINVPRPDKYIGRIGG